MNKLIVFGCSVSANGHLKSWADQVSSQLDILLLNFAIPASSNLLQIKRFQEYVINNTITNNDIIIWQITGVDRGYKRIKNKIIHSNRFLEKLLHGEVTFRKSINYFDNKNRIDYLCHYKECQKMKMDHEDVLQDMIFHLRTAKQFTNKILVIIGWDEAIPNNYRKKFEEYLQKNNIDYISESILSYAIRHNFFLFDSNHPGEEAYISFADNLVIPKIKKLGWHKQ